MSTKTKSTKKQPVNEQKGVAKFSDQNSDLALNSNFDELYNMDEKEVNKQIMFKQNKQAKQLQLMAKINDIKMKMVKAETAYRKSLVDPLTDSIEIAIDIKCLQEQMILAKNLVVSLFPDTKSMFPS